MFDTLEMRIPFNLDTIQHPPGILVVLINDDLTPPGYTVIHTVNQDGVKVRLAFRLKEYNDGTHKTH